MRTISTKQEARSTSITTTNWLIVFKEIIAVYCEKQQKYKNTFCGQTAGLFNVTARGAYGCHCALKGKDT
jgi:hypothetical protein